jgi:branched-chain amino acid transport system substrate-binding protein
MLMTRFGALTALVLLISFASCSPGGAPAGDVIKIGIDLPLSGADASAGQSTLNGALLAIEQANAKGLPGKFKLEADSLDDAVQGVHSPQQGAANARTFVSDPNVLAMIGPYNSNVAAAQIPVTNAGGLVQIGPSVVADGLTLGDMAAQLRRASPDLNTFFRVCTTDSRQGSAAAQFARSLGFRTVYVVDDNETYGLDIANVFESSFQKLGGKSVGHDHLAPNTQDFKALLLKIAATKPDLLFFGGVTSTGGGLMRKQMFDTGMSAVPFMGGDGLADLATVAKNFSDGSYYTVAAADAERMPSAQSFVKAYRKRFGAPVGAYSANAFAATQVAIAAIEKAIRADGNQMPTRQQVLLNVHATSGLSTPIGAIGFDAAGDIRNPVLSLYGFKNGKPYFIKQINLKTT